MIMLPTLCLFLDINSSNVQALIALHEWEPAIEVGRAAVVAGRNWYEALQTLGRAHVGRGDVEEARTCFKKAFHLRPDDRELLEEDLLWCQGLYIHKKAETEALEIASETAGERVDGKLPQE